MLEIGAADHNSLDSCRAYGENMCNCRQDAGSGKLSDMEKVFKIETTLAKDLAELYSGLMEEFEKKSGIALADMNRTLLQTGMIHHLAMMRGLGLLDGEKAAHLDAIIDRVAKDTIMWEVLQMVRKYWQDTAGGKTGTIDYKA